MCIDHSKSPENLTREELIEGLNKCLDSLEEIANCNIIEQSCWAEGHEHLYADELLRPLFTYGRMS